MDRHPSSDRLALALSWTAALASEAGEVAGKLDKLYRDHGRESFLAVVENRKEPLDSGGHTYVWGKNCPRCTSEGCEIDHPISVDVKDQRDLISKELGDVMHCLARLAGVMNMNAQLILNDNVKKIEARKKANTLGGSGDRR